MDDYNNIITMMDNNNDNENSDLKPGGPGRIGEGQRCCGWLLRRCHLRQGQDLREGEANEMDVYIYMYIYIRCNHPCMRNDELNAHAEKCICMYLCI